MNNITLRRTLLVVTAAAAVFGNTSCSREIRAKRATSRADQDYAAGQYDRAEIEYKNALQLGPLNAHAIARLGMMYRIQGRTGPALTFLTKAKELAPNDPDVRLNLGLTYFAAGAPQLARPEALYVIEHRPDDPDAPILLAESSTSPEDRTVAEQRLNQLTPKNRAPVLVALGQLALRANRPEDGQRLFEQALAVDPKSPDAMAALGMLAWARKDFARADERLKHAADASPVRSPRRIQYAQYKYQTGDPATAKRLLAEISKQAPDFIPAWLLRVEIAATEKNYDDAQRLAGEALSRDNSNYDLLLLSARVKLAKGDIDPAITDLERLVSLYPQAPASSYLLGTAYMSKGNWDKAAESLGRAIRLAPGYEPAALSLAELNLRRGSYGTAAAALKPIAAKHSDDTRVQLLLAEASRGSGDLQMALDIYRRLEQATPTDGQLPYLRGLVLRQQGDGTAARAAFERAVQLDARAIQPVQQLAGLDLEARAFDAARQRTELAITRSPKSAELYELLANVAITQGNLADAVIALQRAITMVPNAPAPYVMLARVYVAQNQQEKALAKLQEVIAKNPKNVEALTTTAVLYDVMRKPDEAVTMYQNVLSVSPDSVVALNNLAYLLAARPGELDKAYEMAQRARALLPDDARTADTLGWILCLKGNYPAALALLRDSAPNLTDTPEAQYHLGKTWYMLGNEPAARVALEKALKANGEFSGADDARRMLAVLVQRSPAAEPAAAAADGTESENARDPVVLTRASVFYLNSGNLAKARTTAEAAVAASPSNPAALARLARVLAAQGDRPRAIERARDAHALAPDDADATSVLGRLAYDDRQFRWAASLLQDAARRLPESAGVQFDWARAAYSVGQVADAESAARCVTKLEATSPRGSAAAEFLALLTIASDPSAPADTSVVTATLKRDPANPPALIARAALANRQKNSKLAEATYEQVLQQWPDFAPAQKALAVLYAAHRELPSGAAKVAAKAREAYPGDPTVAKAVGIIAYRTGEFARAVTLLEGASAEFPKDGELRYYLGMAQHRLKPASEAKETLREAIELGLPPDLANEAQQVVSTSE